ncbi:MAG: nicotinate-nucleotide adenylyltransferase [Eubacterium aggregans]|uniref:Probable nicotinate-nucleotide adenylyltransferase n=1 Tax=Eubacterium aggregans TaxID=81409 RepID=A0A1H4DBY3_9FIRM|nr:nicotinate-nucleotide adenylyltransferase [Eubacterium aggregans]MDD4690825.1 nicotinate-nucleotide adenylyltransferase [Eubacterium aggregans]MEA5074397.1 nicotinate-nucleotide adenylyltransferase [Eubacterium aggregans]SEA69960.1 nicotinate-nucleotide adenylyltransferase [Eubacterium aggregans]
MEKIGLLGGSFNPIHTGHLLLAESARWEYQLDKVLFIPTGNNPFKRSNQEISRQARMDMVALAIASNPYFEASDIEMNREGKSYTIDTINALEAIYGDVEFYFITGADIMFEITRWREAEALLRRVTFVTSCRPGYSHKKLDRRIAQLKADYNTRILKLLSSEMDIASSNIRSRIKKGQSIKYLIPEAVEHYILDHRLYQEEVSID